MWKPKGNTHPIFHHLLKRCGFRLTFSNLHPKRASRRTRGESTLKFMGTMWIFFILVAIPWAWYSLNQFLFTEHHLLYLLDSLSSLGFPQGVMKLSAMIESIQHCSPACTPWEIPPVSRRVQPHCSSTWIEERRVVARCLPPQWPYPTACWSRRCVASPECTSKNLWDFQPRLFPWL